MWYRLQIALVFLAPVLLLAGLYVFGKSLPVPYLGRDYIVSFDLPDAGTTVGLPQVQGPQDATRPLVVIHAGHGGHDPGASGPDYREKTIVLGLARALRNELLAQGGIRVALTRDDDRYLVLAERVAIARALDADLFLSIHADSAGDKDEVSGASIYTLSEAASSEAAARFAARENQADEVNGVALSAQSQAVNAILVELSQRRSSGSSSEFAELILREGNGGADAGSAALQFHPQARRSAALAVLRAPDVPSVLYESGFVTNREEAARLASPEGQKIFAKVLARAIRIYFARIRDGA